ncbi:ABC transporter ATP-binding protein [bacterium]|nr:ABC transporter ATP-binding protein [bacterium]
MDGNVIRIANVTRRFGSTTALEDVTLDVPRGSVFGLVGENGAGKTTLIKHILGLLRAREGSVRVFGLDPVRDPVGVLGKIGYLSEDRDLPDWMRVGELMRYTQAFYPKWDEKYAADLVRAFDLKLNQKVGSLSRGQRAQAGLLIALAHRPEMLLLDEPSSGLDAVVRRDILAAIIRTVADEGRTVLFSSHLLEEVERVADRVAMIHHGRLVLVGTMDDVKAGHRRMTLHFDEPPSRKPELPGALAIEGEGREWTCLVDGAADSVRVAAEKLGARIAEEATPSLEEIFVARVKGSLRPVLIAEEE